MNLLIYSIEFCLKEEPSSSEPPVDPTGPAAGKNGPSAAPSEKPADPPASTSTPTSSAVSGKTDASVPTADEVTVAGRKAAEKYGAAAIKPILKEFGVSRISELAEKDRAAFIARLEGLSK